MSLGLCLLNENVNIFTYVNILLTSPSVHITPRSTFNEDKMVSGQAKSCASLLDFPKISLTGFSWSTEFFVWKIHLLETMDLPLLSLSLKKKFFSWIMYPICAGTALLHTGCSCDNVKDMSLNLLFLVSVNQLHEEQTSLKSTVGVQIKKKYQCRE